MFCIFRWSFEFLIAAKLICLQIAHRRCSRTGGGGPTRQRARSRRTRNGPPGVFELLGAAEREEADTKKKKIQCLFNKTQSDSRDLVRRALKLQYLILIIVMKIWRSFKNYFIEKFSSAGRG
jgi:hypothetical protein